MQEIIGDRFKVLKVKKIFETFSADNETINSILGDTTVNGLSSFDANGIKLSSIMDVPTEENGYKNKTMYDILLQSTNAEHREEYTYNDITIGDLQYFDINKLQIKVVLERDKNENLYTILDDATEAFRLSHLIEVGGEMIPIPTNEITIGDLNTAIVFGDIRLSSVIKAEDISENKILQNLIAKDVKLSEVGSTINEMPITDMFDIEVWTKDDSKTIDTFAKYVKVEAEIEPDDPLTPDVDESITETQYVLTDYTVTADNDVYYISSEASVWMFLLYSSGETVVKTDPDSEDLLGLARYYTENGNLTYNDMISSVKTASSAIMTSTIRQIVDAGILNSGANFHKIYDVSIEQAIHQVASLAP